MSEGHRTVLLYIKDILDSIEKIEKFCHDMSYDQFIKSGDTRFSCLSLADCRCNLLRKRT